MAIKPSVVDGIIIRSMTVEDYKEVKPFLSKHFFAEEPLSQIVGVENQKKFEKDNDAFFISLIKEETCLVAIDKNNSNRLIGVVLAGALFPSDLEKNLKRGDKDGLEMQLIYELESKANVFEHYSVSKTLHSHITTVEPLVRGKGLGTRLATTLMNVGRSKGFPLMTADCTSFYSARQKEALGMECVYSLAYADYKNDQGEVVFKPPPPHTHARVMAIKLQPNKKSTSF